MPTHPLAGQPAPRDVLEDIPALVTAYFTTHPDPHDPAQRVSFGTSGHRGSAATATFNEDHIAAISQAIVDFRRAQGVTGPLFLGRDTHALSTPALATALEVFAANEVEVRVDAGQGPTPTPVISHAILTHNGGAQPTVAPAGGLADGVVITPSHNPPGDGGFKYNPPHGGPAGADATSAIARAANRLLEDHLRGVRRVPLARALAAETTRPHDYLSRYVGDLAAVVDLEAIAASGLKLGVDPMGGAGHAYWGPIAERYGLDLEVVNEVVDPTFSFMHLDHDGKIRMDCSSPYAMAGLIALRDRFDLAFGNDTDFDRHGIVTRHGGLMAPNHYLAVAVDYLFRHRPGWPAQAAVGKTLVSSQLIDRVAATLDRRVVEVPVGFKWFVSGLGAGTLGFGGEESAGASFLRRDGRVWTTDKDGFVMDLLAAEIMARTGHDPAVRYATLTETLGAPVYRRVDTPASDEVRRALKALRPEAVREETLAGDPIVTILTRAPGNDAPIGGLKVVSEAGWFAARPSGTEAIYKVYAESFRDDAHLAQIHEEARALIARALAAD